MPASESGQDRSGSRPAEELRSQLGFLEDEVSELRRRLAESPVHSRAVEQRLAETQRSLAAVTAQNERLAQTLREARDQIMTLKEEVDRLAQPPAGFGTFLARNEDDSIDVFTGGRKLRVNVSPSVDLDELQRGQEVMLNEALNVVAALDFEEVGEVVMLKEILADGDRVLVIANADEERVVRIAEPLRETSCAPGTPCCSTRGPATSTRRSRSPRSRSSSSKRSRTSTTATSVACSARSRRSATRSSCPTCTPTCSSSTSSSRRRACCSTARPAAARR